MAVVSLPGKEPWVVAGWAFRDLVRRVERDLASEDAEWIDGPLREELEAARTLDRLELSGIPAMTLERFRPVLARSACSLIHETETNLDDPLTRSWRDALQELLVLLQMSC